ncbi:MAG: hypothetical protein IGR93_10895 [Hydrococcus sp. C42_A2020_068]|nr:hypothetical protein [Hydrococcus sp. C42_A2020_068]
MLRHIGLIIGIGITLVVGSFSASAEPLNEPKPLPPVDASSSSSLDTIEVGNRNRESFFPANPQGTVTNYSESRNENEFDPLGKGFKLDFGDNLRSKRELDASMAPGDDGDNTKVRLLIDMTELDNSTDEGAGERGRQGN